MRKKLCIVLSVLLTRCNKFVIIFSIGELYLRFVNILTRVKVTIKSLSTEVSIYEKNIFF